MGLIFIFIRGGGGVLGNNQKFPAKENRRQNLSAPNLIRKRYHTMQKYSRKTLKNRIGACSTFGDVEIGYNRSYAFSFLSAQSTAIKYHSREPNQFNKYSHFLGTSSSRIYTRSTCRLSRGVSSCFYWRPACGF